MERPAHTDPQIEKLIATTEGAFSPEVVGIVNHISADIPRGEVTKIIIGKFSVYAPLHEEYNFPKDLTPEVIALIALRRNVY